MAIANFTPAFLIILLLNRYICICTCFQKSYNDFSRRTKIPCKKFTHAYMRCVWIIDFFFKEKLFLHNTTFRKEKTKQTLHFCTYIHSKLLRRRHNSFFLSIFWALKRGGNYQILWMKFAFYHQNFFFLKKEIGRNLKKTIQQFQNNYSIYIGNVQRKQLSRRKITYLMKRRKNRIIKYNYMVDDFSQPRWQKLIKNKRWKRK